MGECVDGCVGKYGGDCMCVSVYVRKCADVCVGDCLSECVGDCPWVSVWVGGVGGGRMCGWVVGN